MCMRSLKSTTTYNYVRMWCVQYHSKSQSTISSWYLEITTLSHLLDSSSAFVLQMFSGEALACTYSETRTLCTITIHHLPQKDGSSLTFLYECNGWLQSPNRVSLAVKKRSMCTLGEFEVHRGVSRQRYTKSSVHTHMKKLPACIKPLPLPH